LVAIRIEILHELVSLERLLAQGSHRRPEINNNLFQTSIEAFIDTSEQSLMEPVVSTSDVIGLDKKIHFVQNSSTSPYKLLWLGACHQ
jgi:hypothetical protein